jgi:CheY-like chemotaxis protein
MRVLVVDSDPDCREALRHLLALWGHEARTAVDAVEALPVAAEFLPEVLIVELDLPGMDGWELGKHILSTARTPRPLVIALAGGLLGQDVRKSREAGFDLHLAKPPDFSLLRQILESPGAAR